jgi:hypothetical protein
MSTRNTGEKFPDFAEDSLRGPDITSKEGMVPMAPMGGWGGGGSNQAMIRIDRAELKRAWRALPSC